MHNYVPRDYFMEWEDNIESFLLKTDGGGETEGHNFALDFHTHSTE